MWYIKEIIVEKVESKPFGRLTIEIDFHKGARFKIGISCKKIRIYCHK